MARKAIVPADLPAVKRRVTCEEGLAKRMPFVEDYREPAIDLAQPIAHSQQRQW